MKRALIMAAAVVMGALGWNAMGARGADTALQRVLVIPFSALNVMDSQRWVPRAVQEDIVADLGLGGQYSPIAFQGQLIVEDNATAARLARQASATLAVRGAAQVIGLNVRLTAQLIDAKSGDTVSTASVTGAMADLLKLEDELSAQLRGVSSGAPATPAAPASPSVASQGGAASGSTPIVVQSPAPQIIVLGGATYPSYASYPSYNPYAYPYYNYYYPYSYVGWPGYYPWNSVFFFGSGFHHRDHDRGGRSGGPPHIQFPTPRPGPMSMTLTQGLNLTPRVVH